MSSPEEVKTRAKQLITAMQEIREETLQLPILRKRFLGFTNQIRARQQFSPEEVEVLRQELPAEQNPPTSNVGQAQLLQRPRLLQMTQGPIRSAIGNLINSLTARSGLAPQKQQKEEIEEREEPYVPRGGSNLPHSIRVKKPHKRASIEM